MKQSIKIDEKNYYDNRFNKNTDSSTVWKTVYTTLKINKNESPVQLKVNGKLTNSPLDMANAFNKIFVNKVKKLRDQTTGIPLIDPKE